jgi:hypothetical protein
VIVEIVWRNILQDVVSNPVCFDSTIVERIVNPLGMSNESEIWIGSLKPFEGVDELLCGSVAGEGVQEHVILIWAAVA